MKTRIKFCQLLLLSFVFLVPLINVNALYYVKKDYQKCTETEAHKNWSKLSKNERKKYFEPVKCQETIDGYKGTLKGINRVKSIGNVDYRTTTKFDLRNVNGNNYVTSFKDQMFDYEFDDEGAITGYTDSSLCYAFATNSVIESAYLTEGGTTIDLSERHIGYMMNRTLSDETNNPFGYYGHTTTVKGEDAGGTYLMTGSYLAKQKGPILDNRLPLDTLISTKANTLDVKADYTVGNVIYSFADSCQDENAILNMKRLLTTYGAITSLMSGSDGISDDYSSYYYDGDEVPGHAITIVGWDDTYPKENFKEINGSIPAGDGAWIVKNTYSFFGNENEVDTGYHYTSYYDKHACMFNMAVDNVSNDVSDNGYYYSNLGVSRSLNIEINEMYFKQVFTKKSNYTELLNKINIYGSQEDGYEIYYADEDDFSKSVKLAEGVFEEEGYKTITIENPVSISSNIFYIFFKYISNDSIVIEVPETEEELTNYLYPLQYIPSSSTDPNASYYIENPTSNVTFYSADGTTWIDTLSNESIKFYPVIHAFTDNIDYSVTLGDVKPSSDSINITDGGYFDIPLTLSNISLDDLVIKIYRISDTTGKLINVRGNETDATNDFDITKTNNNIKITTKNTTKAGSYRVDVSYMSVKASKNFSIAKAADILVTKIEISGGDEVSVNGTLNLSAIVTPTSATNKNIKWTSSDSTLATINSSGVVTGIKAGTVTITAEAMDASGVKSQLSLKVIDIGANEGNGPTAPTSNDMTNSNVSSSSDDATTTTAAKTVDNPKTGIREVGYLLTVGLLLSLLIYFKVRKNRMFVKFR